MNILITGAGGFIGKHLIAELSKKHTIIAIDANSTQPGVVNINLLDVKATDERLKQAGLRQTDIVIHLASVLAKADNLNDIEVLNNNNSLSVNVANLAKKLSAKKFINFSSSSVYPNVTGTFSESSEVNPAPNPDAIYGLSKFNSEVIINKFLEGSDISVSHLRCAMVYGEGVGPTRLWPVMEKELAEKNTITVFGNGERLINQVNVSWLAKVIMVFVEKNLSGVYNVSEETISVIELAERIISQKGNTESKINLVEQGNRQLFRMDNSKLKAVL